MSDEMQSGGIGIGRFNIAACIKKKAPPVEQ
jgi:hypothetical protein